MKKIAYFSPLNPIRSGISDYSEDLLPELSKVYDVEVYVENGFQVENTNIKENFVIREYAEFSKRYNDKQYSAILYHMGNNYSAHKEIYEFILKYPGIVVLHDYSLHHFFAAKTLEQGNLDEYREEMLYCHGKEGLDEANRFLNGEISPIWESNSLKYPLNLRILDNSAGIIVHSQFAKDLLREQASYVPIEVVPIPAPHISKLEDIEREKEDARGELGINRDDFVISALGYANPTKRIDKVISALSVIKSKQFIKKFKFYIVGEVPPSYPIQELVRKHKLENEVVFIGYVNLKDFDKYIAASDMCVNLRYPTQGENSASLLKIMGRGKPVITTNIGSFSEFADDVVLKVNIGKDEISHLVEELVRIFRMDRSIISSKILELTNNNHTIEISCLKYSMFIDDIVRGNKVNINLGISSYLDRFTSIFDSIENDTGKTVELNISKIYKVFYKKTGDSYD
ncbi:glycosyltransferase involved in cell wall biosynthesis [Fontibacillus phaseoli]|uniref:Glycosyltransferase involved in cell wall biosynthesis n=1 Tax=Fontibacillus phaseoli TaxID=1416533 RepID=A0A369BEV1_9BACL|nr:glycosyltransferase family 4 protein [Fontibacillus phaseoli]RCX19017.1 glycosyltransferase involved in cell wall biosynthesis [Fontibacillus phaseoli]